MSLKQAIGGISLAILGLIATGMASAQQSERPHVLMSTTLGDFVLELDQERAPQTVQNFLQYVDEGFYEETLFHRVIEGFMIQGGGFSTQYQRKTTRPPVSNEAYNGLRNERYTIAMARTTAPHSATSQFFINSVDNQNLDHTDTSQRGWGYTVFGRVVKGQEVIEAISQVRTGSGGPFSRDVPIEPVVIVGVKQIEFTSNLQPTGNSAPLVTRPLKESTNKSNSPSLERRNSAIQTQPVEQN